MSAKSDEHTSGGLVGRVAGKLKEVIGDGAGSDDLAREGRLQQAQTDAELDARRAEERARAERIATERDAEALSSDRERAAEERRRAETDAARRQESYADAERTRAQEEAATLEREAARKEARADAIDPKEEA